MSRWSLRTISPEAAAQALLRPFGQELRVPKMSKCICKGNWRLIVSEVEHLIGRQYRDSQGKVYVFFGLVHGKDDYYYGMRNKTRTHLLSCVGSIEGYDFTLMEKP